MNTAPSGNMMDLLLIALFLTPFVKMKTVLLHNGAGLLGGFRQNIKESAHALAAKDYAAAVLVGLDGVIHARFTENRFQPQSLLKLLGDIDQIHISISEEI